MTSGGLPDRMPCEGGDTIENVSPFVSGSVAFSLIDTEVFASVVTDWSKATGGSLQTSTGGFPVIGPFIMPLQSLFMVLEFSKVPELFMVPTLVTKKEFLMTPVLLITPDLTTER